MGLLVIAIIAILELLHTAEDLEENESLPELLVHPDLVVQSAGEIDFHPLLFFVERDGHHEAVTGGEELFILVGDSE